jgi:8-amino-7-oxononanoate synthase
MTVHVEALETPTNALMMLGGRQVCNFAGSAYLGISREPELIQPAVDALHRYGARVHLTPEFGVSVAPHVEVERQAASFFGTTEALYISSGYLLGLAALTGLRSQFDLVLLDSSGHYNLRDGAAASGAAVRTFAHLDCNSLESELQRAHREGLRAVVAVDGMCPTFGSIPRLDIYAQLTEKYGAWLFIDESHSFGTLGATGRGAAEECGLGPEQALRGGSLGKAFCAAGAVFVGTAQHITTLRLTPCVRAASWGLVPGAAMAAGSLRLVQARPGLLDRLRANVKYAKQGLRNIGLDIPATAAPLATFVCGTADHMHDLQQRLLEQGIFLLHVRYVGTGPDGVIRCSFFADHTTEQIDRLIAELRRFL